ncbi:MAG: hypothetical protein ACRDQ7_03350, partial [Haloechinothrix sp.]
MDGKQIYQNFTQGNTEALQIASDLVRKLTDEFIDEAQSLLKARDRMLEHWEGDSADAAGKGIDPLAQAHQDSAPHIDRTMHSLGQQAQMFAHSANSVVPVPDAPEKPNPWVSGAKALLPGGAISTYHDYKSYSDGMAQHTAANETNVRVMSQYSSASSQSAGSLPGDYGVLESDGAGVGIGDDRGGSGIAGRDADTPGLTGASSAGAVGGASGGAAGSYGGAPSATGAPHGGAGGGGLAAGAVSGAGGQSGGGTAPGGAPGAPGGVGSRPGAPMVGGVPIAGGAFGGAGSDTTRRGGMSRTPGSPGTPKPPGNAGARLVGGGPKGAAGGAGTPGGTGAPKAAGGNPNLAPGRG